MVCSHISVMLENGIFLYATPQVIFSFQRRFNEKNLINKTETPFLYHWLPSRRTRVFNIISPFWQCFSQSFNISYFFFQMENKNVGKNYPKPYDLKAPFLYFYSSTPVFLLVPFFLFCYRSMEKSKNPHLQKIKNFRLFFSWKSS